MPKTIDSTLQTAMPVMWDCGGIYSDGSVKLTIPAGALYESILLTSSRDIPSPDCAPGTTTLGDDNIYLHKNAALSFDCSDIPAEKRNKLVVARITGGKISSEGGRLSGNRIETRIGRLGTFALALDEEAPEVIPAFRDKGTLSGDKITYRIKDELSGVRWYQLTIDDKWVLLEADPKRLDVLLPSRPLARREEQNGTQSGIARSGRSRQHNGKAQHIRVVSRSVRIITKNRYYDYRLP